MSTTVQILMAVFSVAGFAIAKLHSWACSPVGGDVLKVIAEAVEQQQKITAHGKVKAIATHGVALFRDIAAVRHAAERGQADAAAGVAPDVELQEIIEQATAAYRAKKAQAKAA